MNIEKAILTELKRCDIYYNEENLQDENIIAIKNIIDNCKKVLEKNIKEEEERASKYMDKLLKELK